MVVYLVDGTRRGRWREYRGQRTRRRIKKAAEIAACIGLYIGFIVLAGLWLQGII